MGMALVYRGQRLYGCDCETGRWHRHPAHAPATHEVSPSVNLDEFLAEAQDILIQLDLI
jgi:hypothetical protein